MLCEIGNCWEQATKKVWVDNMPFITQKDEAINRLFVCAKHGSQFAIENPEIVKIECLIKIS